MNNEIKIDKISVIDNEIRVSRMEIIDKLKTKFFGNNPASWRRNSNKQLIDWYKEYILEDKNIKVKIY